jgi:hypothetical protein
MAVDMRGGATLLGTLYRGNLVANILDNNLSLEGTSLEANPGVLLLTLLDDMGGTSSSLGESAGGFPVVANSLSDSLDVVFLVNELQVGVVLGEGLVHLSAFNSGINLASVDCEMLAVGVNLVDTVGGTLGDEEDLLFLVALGCQESDAVILAPLLVVLLTLDELLVLALWNCDVLADDLVGNGGDL